MKLQGTVNFERLFPVLTDRPETKTVVMEGGSRSGKTWSIMQVLILWMLAEKLVVRCFRHNSVTHNETTIADFKQVMLQIGEQLYGEDRAGEFFDTAGTWNKVEKTYTFTNGSRLHFNGTSDISKLHGKGCDIAWYNEVMEIYEEARNQIAMRCRRLEIMDFNPSLSSHWVFDKVITLDSTEHYHSTYKDNPFLDPKQIFEIEKFNPEDLENKKTGTANKFMWDVYGLGMRGRVEGAVYKIWKKVDKFPDPWHCQKHGYALDFGFFPDPAALVEMALFNNAVYMREHFYETGLIITPNQTRPDIPNIHDKLLEAGIDPDAKIYCDNARPEAIRDLQLMGWNAVACTKGKDSVLYGIQLMNRYKLFAWYKSMNLQRELEQYKYKRKPDGTWLQEPEDNNNHLMDPARYWCLAELDPSRLNRKKQKSFYSRGR